MLARDPPGELSSAKAATTTIPIVVTSGQPAAAPPMSAMKWRRCMDRPLARKIYHWRLSCASRQIRTGDVRFTPESGHDSARL
jgi:hypothetical protein